MKSIFMSKSDTARELVKRKTPFHCAVALYVVLPNNAIVNLFRGGTT